MKVTYREYFFQRHEECMEELDRITVRYNRLPRWAWRRRRKLIRERQFVKMMNFDVLYGSAARRYLPETAPLPRHPARPSYIEQH